MMCFIINVSGLNTAWPVTDRYNSFDKICVNSHGHIINCRTLETMSYMTSDNIMKLEHYLGKKRARIYGGDSRSYSIEFEFLPWLRKEEAVEDDSVCHMITLHQKTDHASHHNITKQIIYHIINKKRSYITSYNKKRSCLPVLSIKYMLS